VRVSLRKNRFGLRIGWQVKITTDDIDDISSVEGNIGHSCEPGSMHGLHPMISNVIAMFAEANDRGGPVRSEDLRRSSRRYGCQLLQEAPVPLPTQAFGGSVDVHALLTGVSGAGGERARATGFQTKSGSSARTAFESRYWSELDRRRAVRLTWRESDRAQGRLITVALAAHLDRSFHDNVCGLRLRFEHDYVQATVGSLPHAFGPLWKRRPSRACGRPLGNISDDFCVSFRTATVLRNLGQ
jgi:hypothetical protein